MPAPLVGAAAAAAAKLIAKKLSQRTAGGINGAAGKNVSKVNRNGSASPAGTTSAKKKKAPAKKMTAEEGIAADLNAFLNFNAGR